MWNLNKYYVCLVSQSCLILCDPLDYSPPGTSVCGDSPGKNTGVGCHALLLGIFPTQGSNPGLLHCRWIPYQLSHNGVSNSFVIPWTIAHQAPLFMGFPRQAYVPFPFPRHLPDPRIEPTSPVLADVLFTTESPGKHIIYVYVYMYMYICICMCVCVYIYMYVHI